MEKNQLAETLQFLTEQLNELSRNQDNPAEFKKLNTFKNQLLKVFPQAFVSHKLKGRIEEVIIQINNLYQNRIITSNETFSILLNIYTKQSDGFTMSDMQQLNDSVQIHFQQATIQFEIFHSNVIREDELLLMIEFNS